MGRHAYCILAHNDIHLLNTLLQCIDDVRNDIFIHLDKKSSLIEAEIYHPKNSILYFTERTDVRWGDISMVKAELLLFNKVLNINNISGGGYNVIHLISGQDLPIKSQDYIHEIIDKYFPTANFIGFANGEICERDIYVKTTYYHILTKYFHEKNWFIQNLCKVLRISFLKFQKFLNMHREHGYKELRKGCQWCTIRVNFAQFLVNNTSEILKSFKYIPACDEIYKQTIAWNISDFRNTIYDTNDEFNGSCRMIDWRRGNPYVFRITDLNELLGSNAFFARKFSSNIDSEIIKKIRDHVLNDNASSK